MPESLAVFDPATELDDEIVAVLSLMLLTGDPGPAPRPPVRPCPITVPHGGFRDPRGWR